MRGAWLSHSPSRLFWTETWTLLCPRPRARLQASSHHLEGLIPGQGASHFSSAPGPEDSGASAGPNRERGGRMERRAPRPRSGPWDGSPTSLLPSPAFLTPRRPLHCCAGVTAGPLPASLHLQPGPSLGSVTWSVGPGFWGETQTPELAHRPSGRGRCPRLCPAPSCPHSGHRAGHKAWLPSRCCSCRPVSCPHSACLTALLLPPPPPPPPPSPGTS